MNKNQKLVYLSLLTSLALVVYIIELQLPPLVPIPGVRLGLANMVSLAVLILYGPKEALTILLIRIFLGSFISGRMSSLLFSLCGGLLSNLGMIGLYTLSRGQLNLWLISIIGAILHAFGQVTIAVLITETPGVYFYLPFLLLSSIITGYFIGWSAKFIASHFSKLIRHTSR